MALEVSDLITVKGHDLFAKSRERHTTPDILVKDRKVLWRSGVLNSRIIHNYNTSNIRFKADIHFQKIREALHLVLAFITPLKAWVLTWAESMFLTKFWRAGVNTVWIVDKRICYFSFCKPLFDEKCSLFLIVIEFSLAEILKFPMFASTYC